MEVAKKRGPLPPGPPASGNRTKFIVGGVLILAAVAYLIISSTRATAQYFLTVEELQARKASLVGRSVRVSGAVIGDSIRYDAKTLELQFTIANVPADMKQVEAQGGLAAALEQAVRNPEAARLEVAYTGPKPDLLRDQAQAILTGHLSENGVFDAGELLLKCPTRYQSALPSQSQ